MFGIKNRQSNILKPSDFRQGAVYKMAVASRSIVTEPYYVIVNEAGENFIKTCIPGKREMKIEYGTETWQYHVTRMTFVGFDPISLMLIYNQSLN
jgi:hypothetical protein